MTPRFPREPRRTAPSHGAAGPLSRARRGDSLRPSTRGVSPMRRALTLSAALLLVALQVGCPQGSVSNDQVCQFQCDYTQDGTEVGYPAAAAGVEARLTVRDVVQVIANAIHEAEANGIPDVTIVVLDHLSNVLAVYDTDAATTNYSLITSVESPDRTQNTPFIVEANGNSADFGPVAVTAGLTSLQTALDGVFIPAGYAAISKAGTSNYFSTQGNAFTSRTASTLIQQNFFPGETDRPGGPLFAVQIAQLACSDINTRQSVDQVTDTTLAPAAADLIGPRRLPVGFAADPGGISLYKDNIAELDAAGNPTGNVGKVVVGAVGVEYNGIYGVDKNATNSDRNLEERIAYGATIGATAAESYDADVERRASRITVAGRALRWVDDTGLRSARATAPVISAADVASLAAINTRLNGLITIGTFGAATTGEFVTDQFFFPFNAPRAGVFFLDPTSGVVAENYVPVAGNGYTLPAGVASVRGEKLVDRLGNDRYPAIPSVNPAPPGVPAAPAVTDGLSDADVQELLVEALRLAENTRAQTRRPLGGQARIDVAVVDLDGNVLGFARSQDALLDGVDVTIAKTRQAAFWSKNNARTQLLAAVDPLNNVGPPGVLNAKPLPTYVADTRAFLGLAPADPLFDGEFAWSSIALGGIANPDFPPGVASGDNGPLSRNPESTTATAPQPAPTDEGEWSIFSTGIQTEIVLPGIAVGLCEEVPDLAAALFDTGVIASPVPRADLFTSAPQRNVFCDAVRTAVVGSADAGAQLDCMQGVQDGGAALITGLQNGFHIFQGAVPIYRTDAAGNAVLVGGYGVSGDGAEQDDFVPFVALDEIGKAQAARGIANPIGNAPPVGVDNAPADGRPDVQRADNISVQNVFLRYVVCPVAPFLSSNEQNGCEGR